MIAGAAEAGAVVVPAAMASSPAAASASAIFFMFPPVLIAAANFEQNEAIILFRALQGKAYGQACPWCLARAPEASERRGGAS